MKGRTHPFYKGLRRLFSKDGYIVYADDRFTTGIIETPTGWVDHWLRYELVGEGMRFGFDAPERISKGVRDALGARVAEELALQQR